MVAEKRKQAASQSNKDITEIINNIRQLERQVAESKTHFNNIVTLSEYTENDSPKVIHAAMHALYRIFSAMITRGELQRPKKTSGNNKEDPQATVTLWLRDHFIQYTDRLCIILHSSEAGLSMPALKLSMDLVKVESAFLSSVQHHFANDRYQRIVEALLVCPNMNHLLLKEFTEKYIGFYDDLRFYFLKNTAAFVNNALGSNQKEKKGLQVKKQKTNTGASADRLALILKNSFAIMETLKTMPTEAKELDEFWSGHPDPSGGKKAYEGEGFGFSDEEDEAVEDLTKEAPKGGVPEKRHPLLMLFNHKRVFSDCWIAILRLPFTAEIYKKTLLLVHKRIIPHLPQPSVLMDFLTDSYNAGGAISLLALNGLFTLITEHNLDYPDFYQKLYKLFDRNLMHVKYRSRFFRLVDIFLASTLLPAQLVAAFIKRMARLTLTSPPASIVIMIPLIYNLLKKHPTCMQLIHGPKKSETVTPLLAIGGESEESEDSESSPAEVPKPIANGAGSMETDKYDATEQDPMKCHALQSSLWELETLQNHVAPNVATLAKIFSEQFTKPSYNLEDFLDHTYATMFQNEIKKKRKGDAAMAVEIPKGLFVASTEEGDEEGLVLGWESWAF